MYSTDSPSRYTSIPLIYIEGASADQLESLRTDILQVTIEESLHLPGMFSVAINNPYVPTNDETTTWQYDSILQIGNKIRLGFRASTTDEQPTESMDAILEGEITAIETHFTSSTQAPIVVRGYDLSHRLHRGRHNRSFQDVTDGDLVTKIATEVGFQEANLSISTALAGSQRHRYVYQENQTNMEFLRDRAARIGYELFVQDGTLSFRPPEEGETLELQWLSNLESFRVRVTSAEQVDSVEVRSWDYYQKQPIISVAQTEEEITAVDGEDGSTTTTTTSETIVPFTNSNASSNLPSPKTIVVDKPIASANEGQYMAQALFNELNGEFIYADARTPGNPDIRVGKVVELTMMGRYSGKYYVTETRHLFYEGIYSTEFSVRGLRGGSILKTLSPETRLRPGQTHLVGIVTDNQDPEGLGRVRVKFPTLNPEADGSSHASWWARVVGVGAGTYRGFDCLPEINDEVLVAFEHGDIHRPYVIGGVWNGLDRPPVDVDDAISDQGKVRLRTLQTRTGHQLQFVEEDKNLSKDGIYLKTSGGHLIQLNDSDGAIAITTPAGNQIVLNDSSPGIQIQTPGGHFLTLSDSSQTLSVYAAGTLNLHSLSAMNLFPGAGQVTISGNVSCVNLTSTAITTGTLMLGTGATAVNVGTTLSNLQTSVAAATTSTSSTT